MDYEKLLKACPDESLDKATLGVIAGMIEWWKNDRDMTDEGLINDVIGIMESYEKLNEQTK
jgi:hypothetical protein